MCQGNMTASLGGAALFIPRYECDSPVAPSDFDRLISGYRLTQTPLLGNPCFTKTYPVPGADVEVEVSLRRVLVRSPIVDRRSQQALAAT